MANQPSYSPTPRQINAVITPSPRQIERAMTAAMQLREELGDSPDAKLLQDTLEGETDVFARIDQLAEQVLADEALADIAMARAKRLEKRAETFRDTVLRMLDALGLAKLERGGYTASIQHRSHVVVTDPSALPSTLLRTAPDARLIGQILRKGEAVPGAQLGNPEPSLTMRIR